jgi:quercetin dioxygenase-like cupin family protein
MSNDMIKQAWWSVVGPEEGESIWQPQPSNGYVTLKLTTETMPYDNFTSGIQVMPPGCQVRKHAHTHNHELIFVYEGTGRCQIEGKTYELSPETTVLFGRYAEHTIENTGDTDLRMFWVFFPPALEHFFRAIGKPRQPNEVAPEPFPRPQSAINVMQQLGIIPPKPDIKTNK